MDVHNRLSGPQQHVHCLDAAVDFLCYYMAYGPVRRQEISRGIGFLMIVILPFVIWATAMFSLLAVAVLFDNNGRELVRKSGTEIRIRAWRYAAMSDCAWARR